MFYLIYNILIGILSTGKTNNLYSNELLLKLYSKTKCGYINLFSTFISYINNKRPFDISNRFGK